MTISGVMQQYWTNFAKTGNPNGEGLPVWPVFRNPERSCLQFRDTGPTAKQGLRRPFCDLYIENAKRLIEIGRRAWRTHSDAFVPANFHSLAA
jgi:hypothetical protein